MGATLAHMSGNRWGLNVVSGWSEREFGMMGVPLEEHQRRYEKTGAFIEILQNLWHAERQPFDYDSEWYQVKGGEASPVPDRPPEIANAGSSSDGRDLTARLCDWAFVSTPSIGAVGDVVNDIQARAAAHGRSVKTAIFPFVVMGESLSAAEAALAEIIAGKDDVATKNWLHDLTAGSGSFDAFTENMLSSSGGGVHVLGTADAIAEQLEIAFIAGVDAVMLTFPRYKDGLQAFIEAVLPLLQRRGVV
jgi:alkanesulfonate monooxygenase SsuD/methylene tetrahydromethanopterin reductase-like flavin-dependent oxidoreductase (luciferase family)